MRNFDLYIFAHNSKSILPQRASLAGIGSHLIIYANYSGWFKISFSVSCACATKLINFVPVNIVFQITFKNEVGVFDLEVTTFQMAVLFTWNHRRRDIISFENLRLATELPDNELRKTLWVSCKSNLKLSSSSVDFTLSRVLVQKNHFSFIESTTFAQVH